MARDTDRGGGDTRSGGRHGQRRLTHGAGSWREEYDGLAKRLAFFRIVMKNTASFLTNPKLKPLVPGPLLALGSGGGKRLPRTAPAKLKSYANISIPINECDVMLCAMQKIVFHPVALDYIHTPRRSTYSYTYRLPSIKSTPTPTHTGSTYLASIVNRQAELQNEAKMNCPYSLRLLPEQ